MRDVQILPGKLFLHYSELPQGSLARAIAFLEPTETISAEQIERLRPIVFAFLDQRFGPLLGGRVVLELSAAKSILVQIVSELQRQGLIPSVGSIAGGIDVRGDELHITWQARRGR